MQIIIVGDGKVGVALTEQLSSEGHDITVIDSNPKVLEQSLDQDQRTAGLIERESRAYEEAKDKLN